MKRLLIFFLILSSFTIYGKKNIPTVMLQLRGRGVELSENTILVIRMGISDILTRKGYELVDETVQKKVIKEQVDQHSKGCYDNECLVKTGQMLSAQAIFSIEIVKIGKVYIFNLKYINTEKGTVEKSTSLTYENSLNEGKKLLNFSKKVTKEAFKEEKQIADEKKVGEVLEKNNKNQDNKDPKLPKIYYNQVDGYPSVGSKNALVTIVEYSDYQCPYCRRAQSTLKKIIDNYDGKVRVVWKDNPLGFHKNAMPTAQIGWLIFKEKGEKAFRKARDMFYNNYRELTTEKLISIAKEFGISDDKVRETIKNKIFVDKINKSQTEGNKVGARGTPTFFINGRILNGAQPYNNFKKIVDEELEKAEAMVKKGSSPSKVYDEIMDRAERKFVRTPRKNRVQKKDDNKIYDIAQNDHSPYWGEKKAKVTIIEFSEFQCPFCKRVVPVLHKLKKKYGNKIRIEFRHLPLSFHKYAMNAAKASMAAYKQGQFWQMHDLLFANNKELTEDDLIGYANKLGLNINQFESDMKDSAIEKMIKNDMEVASKVGARGTPTFFINGKKLVGARPYTDFEQAVEDALKRVDK